MPDCSHMLQPAGGQCFTVLGALLFTQQPGLRWWHEVAPPPGFMLPNMRKNINIPEIF